MNFQMHFVLRGTLILVGQNSVNFITVLAEKENEFLFYNIDHELKNKRNIYFGEKKNKYNLLSLKNSFKKVIL